MDRDDSRAPTRLSRRHIIGRVAATGAGAALAASLNGRAFAQSDATPAPRPSATLAGNGGPTIVLVHGAWADGSGWSGVLTALDAAGVTAIAVANPLRSLSGDSAYVASVVSQIAGPVLLVGHSYGGAVVTNAASNAANVVGLVFAAAFIPDEGETLLGLASNATDSLLGPALRSAPYPLATGGKPGTELFIDRASFHAVFCADLPAEQAAVMAATQRPATDVAFGEPTANPGWKKLPSWAVVSTADKAIGATGLRLMAQRAGATTTEVDAAHAVMISQPAAVTAAIQAALAKVS